jgi:hypothetical protein
VPRLRCTSAYASTCSPLCFAPFVLPLYFVRLFAAFPWPVSAVGPLWKISGEASLSGASKSWHPRGGEIILPQRQIKALS